MRKYIKDMMKFSFWLLLCASALIGTIYKQPLIFPIVCGFLIIISILIVVLEKSKVTKIIDASIQFKDYIERIEAIKKILPKLYFEKNRKLCLITLVELYMLNDEAIKAKYLFEYNECCSGNREILCLQSNPSKRVEDKDEGSNRQIRVVIRK